MNIKAGDKVKFLGCEIVYREACRLAAASPFIMDVQFMQKGLHDLSTADMLKNLQQQVDITASENRYKALVLGYARCNDGLVGLQAPENLPLVIPRAHDCITLLLGSREAYSEYFDKNPGTYFRSSGWSERDDPTVNGQSGIMDKLGLTMSFDRMVEKYGRDNAEFIQQTLGDWRTSYKNLCYIEMGVLDERDHIEQARQEAADNNWNFDLQKGDLSLLEKLINGDWDDDFVIVRPGEKIVDRNDTRILDAE